MEDVALLKFESLNDLMEINGVEFLDHYRNRVSGVKIVQYLASVIREDLYRELKSSFCFGICFDSSQDISTKEQLILTVKFLDTQHKVHEKFLTIINRKSKDAMSIFNKVWEILLREELSHKLVGISTDGEKKIASKKNGVIGQIIGKLPYVLHSHCVCRNLLLGIKDIFKKKDQAYIYPVAEDLKHLNDLAYKVASFFLCLKQKNRHPKAEEEFFENSEFNDNKLIRPFDIRCLSNFEAFESLIQLYPAVIKALESLNKSEKDLVTEILETEFKKSWNVMYLHMYADILSPLYSLPKKTGLLSKKYKRHISHV